MYLVISPREHIYLLDSVERYGIGNWEDISRQINKLDNYGLTHSPTETEEEFCRNFINGKIGNHTWREDQRGRARDHTQGNPLLPPSQPPDAPSDLSLNEAIVLGYMPKRDDFEVEFDNDAEQLVSPLPSAPNPDEEDIDVALKMAQVDMYKLKLRERERRKRVSNEHQLISESDLLWLSGSGLLNRAFSSSILQGAHALEQPENRHSAEKEGQE